MIITKETRLEWLAGVALFDQGREEAAAAVFNNLPGCARIAYNEAAIRAQQGDVDAAMYALDLSLRYDPSFVAAHMLRGVLLLEEDACGEALASFHAAMKGFPRPQQRPAIDYSYAGAPFKMCVFFLALASTAAC